MLNTHRHNSRLVVILVIFACAWFLGAYLHKTANSKLYFDSGWHATVAKNLANGIGYASSYNGYIYFDPDVTTGPVPITLVAAAIGLIGNQYSLPIYVISILHLGLAIGIVVGVFRIAGVRAAIVFALSLALLLSYYESRWWHVFTGDMSTLLWGILGLQLAVNGVEHGRNGVLFAAGLVLGLSLMSKAVGILPLAGVGTFVLVSNFRTPAKGARALLPIALGVALCLSPWLLYKSLVDVPSVESDATVTLAVHDPLAGAVVGLVPLWRAPNKIAHIKKSLAISKSMFQRKLGSYGLPAYSYLLFFLSTILLLIYAGLNLGERHNQLLLALALTATGYWVWHLLLCIALEDKYTLYPMFMSLVLILYWLCSTRLWWLAPTLLILWVGLGSASARNDVFRFYSFGYEKDAYRSELTAVIAELNRYGRDSSSPPVAACGWRTMPWPLEYVLPGSNNFIDCYQHLKKAMVKNPQTGKYQWREDVDLGFTLVVEVMLWALDRMNDDKNTLMLDICADNERYTSTVFRIMECRDADIREKIVPAPDSPFLQLRRPGDLPGRKKSLKPIVAK